MTTIRVWTNYLKSGDQPTPQVQAMDLEEYLRGVVPHEMSPSAPLEALKAQAVAARTFAMGTLLPNGRPRHGDTADVCITDHCQAWSAQTFPSSDAAVLSTAGQYLRVCLKSSLAPRGRTGTRP
jgi:stage II sporulation protein D (peptidoglycan lytic transglycosylase)